MNKSGFNKDIFEKLYTEEQNSFWFTSRNKMILYTIEKYFPNWNSFHEVGCGTGFVLSAIRQKWPERILSGSDLFKEGLQFAAKRLPGIVLTEEDATQYDGNIKYDIIGAFDVLEHIVEDKAVLANFEKATNTGVIITVPQHMFMWSEADDKACHVRRYTQKELKSKLTSAGFDVIYMTGFVSLLFPAMFLSRKLPHKEKSAELQLPKALNKALSLIMKIEFQLLKAGIRFPFGGSIIAVAQKR
jgi:SAM-dependent methyltransferase